MVESKEELKNRLMRVTEESEKASLNITNDKTMIMAFSPITSWEIKGEKVEAVTDLLFMASKITVGGDCSHKIKRLAPWKKSYDQPKQHIKKQRLYFANKDASSQSYGFSSGHV